MLGATLDSQQYLQRLQQEIDRIDQEALAQWADLVYQAWRDEKLTITPGWTGLWRIAAKRAQVVEERVELDIEYIERKSWQLDVQIFLQTLRLFAAGRGAG